MNKKSVFVDTGAWFAIADKNDQFHKKATAHLKKLVGNKDRLITSNVVIHETVMLLSRKISKDSALYFLDMMNNSANIEIIHTTEKLERSAYEIFKKFTEHDFSIADCVSFVMMKEFSISRAFTFDKHFKVMKLPVEPA